jgi:hypothetical protein
VTEDAVGRTGLRPRAPSFIRVATSPRLTCDPVPLPSLPPLIHPLAPRRREKQWFRSETQTARGREGRESPLATDEEGGCEVFILVSRAVTVIYWEFRPLFLSHQTRPCHRRPTPPRRLSRPLSRSRQIDHAFSALLSSFLLASSPSPRRSSSLEPRGASSPRTNKSKGRAREPRPQPHQCYSFSRATAGVRRSEGRGGRKDCPREVLPRSQLGQMKEKCGGCEKINGAHSLAPIYQITKLRKDRRLQRVGRRQKNKGEENFGCFLSSRQVPLLACPIISR